MEQKRTIKKKIQKTELITNNQQVVLASSSRTRGIEIKRFFNKAVITKHKINELKEKHKALNLNAKNLAFHLARLKAISVSCDFKDKIVIGCDQTLECNGKTLSKPNNLIEAKSNLIELSGKKHNLFTCLYVLKNLREYFVEETAAELDFKMITKKEIDEYIKDNKDTVLSCVGSYRIEENEKYNFIKIIKGNRESIIGFPLKKLLAKIMKDDR